MEVWHFIAPILIRFCEDNPKMYVTVYHALKLEEEYQLKKEEGSAEE